MKIEAAGLTDAGPVRGNNEDAFRAEVEAGAFLVSDGMGGQAAGDVASRLAVETVTGHFRAQTATLDRSQIERVVREAADAFQTAHKAVCIMTRLAGRSAGATLVGLFPCGEAFVLANVGDSRAYRIHAGGVRRLSRDHCLVPDKVARGLMTPEEAARSPERHVLSRTLGMEGPLEVDTGVIPAEPGDLFLLCSDGLSDVLDDGRLLELALSPDAPDAASVCARLLAGARDRGARDNVTVVAVRCLA